jgi:23S rRNA (cytosine1962-C5)-methyltransferase
MAAAQMGASVTHVDASKTANAWARENAAASGLGDKPIRWITEDALTFLRRELKRDNHYDGIIMDPPAFGHGPKGELWKIERDFLPLMKLCRELLSEKPLFVLLSGYASGYSSLMFRYNLAPLKEKFGGEVEHGELTLEESNSGRLLPCGIFGRWSK